MSEISLFEITRSVSLMILSEISLIQIKREDIILKSSFVKIM